MSRVKIEIPSKKPLFIVKIPVRITDMNYGNHLGNDRFLIIAQEARVQWLSSMNCSELDIGDGIGLIMTDAVIIFKREGYYGDILEIKLYLDDLTHKSFNLYYEIWRECDLLAQIKTGVLGFKYAERAVSSLSASILKALKET